MVIVKNPIPAAPPKKNARAHPPAVAIRTMSKRSGEHLTPFVRPFREGDVRSCG